MALRLSEVRYGALLTYSPNGRSDADIRSQGVMTLLKTDGFVQDPPVIMSQWVAQQVRERIGSLPFASLFQRSPVLVPVPSSSLMRQGTLWVPQRIATALLSAGLGRQVATCLARAQALPKAAWSAAGDRPTAQQQYDTMTVQGSLSEPGHILLIDDIVTRGATFVGAANRLADLFPNANIDAFAAMRTVSNPEEFRREYDPQLGSVRLRSDGSTLRRP
jgi:predicted amidophosphoribosyltransferase